MNVSAAARSIGLVRDDAREMCGTIDEDVVLTSISSLDAAQPGNDDFFADVAMRVQLARSAGVSCSLARPACSTVPAPAGPCSSGYRSAMAGVFTDLAIDVGLKPRRAGQLGDRALGRDLPSDAERFADMPA